MRGGEEGGEIEAENRMNGSREELSKLVMKVNIHKNNDEKEQHTNTICYTYYILS